MTTKGRRGCVSPSAFQRAWLLRGGGLGSGGALTLYVLQAGSLALQCAQVIKLGGADLGRAHQFDAVDDSGIDREDTLDALAEADLAHGEAGLGAAALGDDDAFERLHALFVAFL